MPGKREGYSMTAVRENMKRVGVRTEDGENRGG